MKEKKICKLTNDDDSKSIQIPFISTSSVQQDQCENKILNNKDGVHEKRKRKCNPKKYIYHKDLGTNPVPSYSDYRALKLREKYRQRQMDFVDGKFPGIKLSIINFEPSKDLK